MNYFTDVLRDKYAEFTGRAGRREFWMYYLIVIAINVGLAIITSVFADSMLGGLFGVISSLFSLAILVPTLALCVRRLHDIGKDWGWIFIALIPFVGWIWAIVLYATQSQPGDNQWGPMPVE